MIRSVNGRRTCHSRVWSTLLLLLLLLVLPPQAEARKPVTVRSHYPDLGLDSLTQILWSRSREDQLEFEKRGYLFTDTSAVALIDRILLGSGRVDTSRFDYRVQLVHDATLNASAFPNGRIYLHATLLCFFDTEAELATVMYHEWAHVLRQHSRQRMSLDSLNYKAHFWRTISLGLTDLGNRLQRREMAYSRDLEVEADSLGLLFLLAEGYEARAPVRLWTRLDSLSIDFEGEAYEFHAGHKTDSERIADFDRWLGSNESGSPWKHTTAGEFRALQHRLLPQVLRNLCVSADEQLAGCRPDSAVGMELLDRLLERAPLLGLDPDELRPLELHRDLVLAGRRDGSLEKVAEDLARAREPAPRDHELALLHANSLERLERLPEALPIYQELYTDPDCPVRKGMLRIRIQRIEKHIKEHPPDESD